MNPENKETGEPMFKFKPITPEEAERRASAEKRAQENQRQVKVDELFLNSDLPVRHLKFNVPASDGPWNRALAAIQSKLDSGSGPIIGICGERGNGKTQLSVEAARGLIEQQQRSAFFTTATSFFSRIQKTYSDKSESSHSIIEEMRKFKLLIVDEVGKRSDSNWENNLLFELINHRYNDVRPTILIDNRKKEDFIAGVGPSIASRMLETGGIIEASWESFRK